MPHDQFPYFPSTYASTQEVASPPHVQWAVALGTPHRDDTARRKGCPILVATRDRGEDKYPAKCVRDRQADAYSVQLLVHQRDVAGSCHPPKRVQQSLPHVAGSFSV